MKIFISGGLVLAGGICSQGRRLQPHVHRGHQQKALLGQNRSSYILKGFAALTLGNLQQITFVNT